LEEFVQFCRQVGAEPLMCVRVTKRSPRDAADQVAYFNGAADTAQGKLRAKNGHRQPYGIKYWQVGNERSDKDYEDRLAAFCKAMKKADPTITLLSSYPTAGVLRQAGDLLDAQQLYATQAGNRPLQVKTSVPPCLAPDISATLSPRGDCLIVFAVNDTFTDIRRPLDFSAFGTNGQDVAVWTFADRQQAGEPGVANSFADPARIVPVSSTFHATSVRFSYCFPALSLTVIKWRVKKGTRFVPK
jgi:alpha-L-arabinofuranosidase